MIIDIHAHIWGKTPQRLEDSRQALLSAKEDFQIDRIYVSGLWNYFSDEAEVDFLNCEVSKLMAQAPELIGGAVYLNPKNKNVMDVLKRATQDDGFELIKLWCCTRADDPSVDPIMEYAADNGLPVLFHALKNSQLITPGETYACHVAQIARRHPKTKVLMAHFGGSAYDGIPAVRDVKNIWCDFSGSMFHGDDLNYAVEQIGADRILFGTDNLYPQNIGQVLGADLTDEQRNLIFYKNAQKILNTDFRL